MKLKSLAIYALAAAVATAPMSAEAHGWHHGPGPVLGLFALGAAVAVGTAAILTAPIRAVAEAPPYYGPAPGYAGGPPPGYYAGPPRGYYAPAPYPYYAYAPPAYYQPPYYAPYYGR